MADDTPRRCATCKAELNDLEHSQCWDCYYEEVERGTDAAVREALIRDDEPVLSAERDTRGTEER